MYYIPQQRSFYDVLYFSNHAKQKLVVATKTTQSYERGEGVGRHGNPLLYNFFFEFSETKCWETNCCYIFSQQHRGKIRSLRCVCTETGNNWILSEWESTVLSISKQWINLKPSLIVWWQPVMKFWSISPMPSNSLFMYKLKTNKMIFHSFFF